MKQILVAWSCLLLLALLTPVMAEIAPELREPDVLYFEGNLPDKVIGTVHAPTTVYIGRDFQVALAALYPGQKIELIGMATEGYLLRATYRNNLINGWIKPQDLPSGLDPNLFIQAKNNQARHDAVTAAIANKTVIQGMTSDEVRQAVGNPEQTASRNDVHGSTLTWIYTTYREEPQYSYALDARGRALVQTYYVKVPVGQLIVGFDHDTVISVEQHQTDPSSPGVVRN